MYTTLYATAFAVELIRRKRSEFENPNLKRDHDGQRGLKPCENTGGSTTTLGVEDVAHPLRSSVLQYVSFIGMALLACYEACVP